MLTSLNAEVANAASRHGWQFVGGITSQFLNHGYCAANHRVVRWLESKADQGDENGTLHPNELGHNIYRDRLATRLSADLYAGGDPDKPRRPKQRLEVKGKLAADPSFADLVGPGEPNETVTIRARVSGPDNAARSLSYTLEGPGSLGATSGLTDANGETTFTYRRQTPPPPTGHE